MMLAAMLDEAIGLEEKIHACYRALSRLSDNGLSAELRELAQEEKSHVNVLRTGKSFVIRAPGAFGSVAVSCEEIRQGLKAAERLEEDLLSARLGLADGVHRLAALEKRFERAHFHTSVEIQDFAMRKLFEALARADAEHHQRLERLLDGV
jgi:hypothetical protein